MHHSTFKKQKAHPHPMYVVLDRNNLASFIKQNFNYNMA